MRRGAPRPRVHAVQCSPHVGAREPADSPDDANVSVSVPFLPGCIRRLARPRVRTRTWGLTRRRRPGRQRFLSPRVHSPGRAPTCALTNLLVHSDERTEFVVATRNITNKSSFGLGALTPERERRRSISPSAFDAPARTRRRSRDSARHRPPPSCPRAGFAARSRRLGAPARTGRRPSTRAVRCRTRGGGINSIVCSR